MGRSYHNDHYDDDHDRRRAKKKLQPHKKKRHHDKAHLKEFTSGNLDEEDFLEIEEDEHGRKHPRI